MGSFGFRRRGLEGPNPGGCLHGAGIPDTKPSTAVAFRSQSGHAFISSKSFPEVNDVMVGSGEFDGSGVIDDYGALPQERATAHAGRSGR